MKAIVCEMCGSQDLLKENGVFVCQSCGTKYSLEEAKKMLQDNGPVDVSGSTVKVDNSEFVQRYLQNARRARQKEDWEETEKYYNLVEQNDPTNIEAIFYSSYGKAKASLVENDVYKRQAVFKVLNNCVSIIDDNYDINDAAAEKEIIQQISDDIIAMSGSTFVFTQTKNGYGVVTGSNANMTYTMFNDLNAEFAQSLLNIIAKHPQGDTSVIYLYRLVCRHYEYIAKFGRVSTDNQRAWLNRSQEMHRKIKLLDPSYNMPDFSQNYQKINTQEKNSKTGCIIGVICAVIIAISIGVIIGLS